MLCCVHVQERYYFGLMEFVEYLLHARHFEIYFSHKDGHYYTYFTDDETEAQKGMHVNNS